MIPSIFVAIALLPLALAAPAPAADEARYIVTLRESTNRGQFMRTVRGRFTGRDAFRHTCTSSARVNLQPD